MAETQYHIIKTTLLIKKVALTVRFPCSIFFQLRNQSNTVSGRMNYDLKNGLCEPEERIAIDADIPVHENGYPEYKMTLTILMSSANSKIPAGAVDIKITSNGKLASDNSDMQMSIDKCPDKNARINFSFKTELVRSHKKMSANQSIGAKSKLFTYSRVEKYQPSYDVNLKKHSQVHRTTNRKITHHMTDGYDDGFERGRSDGSSSNKSIIYEEFDIGKGGRDKIKKLEREKNEYKKQIAKLRNEIYDVKKEEKWGGYENQLQRYRSEIDSLSNEVVHLKDKNKALQRKQRDGLTTIKNLKQQVQKLNSKSSASETLNVEAKLMIDQKQNKIRHLVDEVKQLKEEIEDMKINNNMQEKRIQFKEATYKEQLQKMSDKYQQSETQRQKATYQLSQMLNDFQNSEKKHQLQNKDRERGYLEEKNKLSKKIQNLTVQLENAKETISDLNGKVSEQDISLNYTNKAKEELINELQQTKVKLEAEEAQFKKLDTKNIQNTKQLTELREIHQQYLTLKKKHVETSSELIRVTQNYNRAQKTNNNLQTKIKDIENSLMGTNKDKDGLVTKTHELHKEKQVLMRNIESRDREINQLNDSLSQMSNKLSEYRVKLDSQKMDHQETTKKLSGQIVYLIKTNEYQQSEMEEMKWKLQKAEELGENMNNKCANLNEKILKTSEDLINEQEKVKNYKDLNKEQENQIELLKAEIINKQTRQKQLHNSIKTKNDTEFDLKKKIKEKEQEIYLLKEKDRQREAETTQKYQELEATITDRQEQITKLRKQFEKLTISLDETSLAKDQHSKNIDKIQQQNAYHVETINTQKTRLSELQKTIAEYKDKLNESEEQVVRLKANTNDLNNKLKEKCNELQNLNKEWEKYKTDTYNAMENFFTEINKEALQAGQANSSQFELLTFPDENLSNIQIQAFKKRVQLLNKYEETIKELKQTNNMLSNQNEKTKKQITIREDELEEIINREKEKFKQYSSQSLSEVGELSQKIINLQDKLHEAMCEHEKVSLQLAANLAQKEELNREIESVKEQLSKERQEIKTHLKSISDLQKQIQHYKDSSQSSLQSTISEKKAQIEKLKGNIRELEKKNIELQKNISIKEDHNQTTSNKLAEMTHNKEKLEKKIEFSEIKFSQLNEIKNRIEKELLETQMKLKNSIEGEEKQREATTAQKLKVEDLTIKLKQALSQNQELQTKIDQLNKQIQELTTELQNLDENTNKLKENNKNNNEKASQKIKELQEKIIGLNSDIQLKKFLTEQQQLNISELKSQIEEFTTQLSHKKSEIISLQEENENVRNQIILVNQNYESLQQEKQLLETELSNEKELVIEINNQLMENQITSQVLATKEREMQRLREQNFTIEVKTENTNKELRNTISELKKELAAKGVREEELKRKFRELERQLETKVHDLKSDKTRIREQSDKEKFQIFKQLDNLDRENKTLRNQLDYVRQNLNHQIDEVNYECSELTSLVAEREEQLNNKNQQIKEYEKKIKIMSAQLKNCMEGWEKDKADMRAKGSGKKISDSQVSSSKYQKFIDEIDLRSKNLLSKSKVGTIE